ncbi:T9SS type A sorting domain-containing protein [Neolewinella persica]|uniref:T9SS type A sorting domain-containing protein n=1 Tax=Neolewinella persica TaxID=70998 RepID=UPI000380B99F|nr:T9SS type A sorting domain-containing protein [Neolewinella persica]
MQKLLLFLLATFTTFSASAQEVITSEQQGTTLASVLNIVLPVRVEYDVANYKITYSTIDALGQPDTASGLLCIPLIGDVEVPMAVYNHGTVGERNAVPSNPTTGERLLSHAIAATGYITVAPDYIGLGDSDGIHPYVHAASEASAGRDLVIAVRKWLEEENVLFNDQLFLTGYSQGGHATQALHRDIQTNPGDDGLEVTAASHLSGPYSISEVMAGTLFSEGLATLPGYIAYTYVSYNSVYGLFDSLAQAFVPPYLPLVEAFASEELSLDDFNTQLTQMLMDNNALLADILQDSVRQTLASGDPTAPINIALADNDTYDWAPTAPTLIYYCTQDEQVPFRNAIIADSVMRANGSTSVVLETGGARTHGGCVVPALVRTLEFWEQYAERIPLSLGVPVARPDVTLAPNPVLKGSELRLSGLGNAALPYHLYDPTGRQVIGGTTTTNGTLRLPNHVSSGLHVLRIGLENGTSLVRRVIVK